MTTHPTPEARYVLDFTATLDGGRAAVITDTVTQAGEYLYSDMDPFTFAMVDQQHRMIAALSAELAAARAERDVFKTKLEDLQSLFDYTKERRAQISHRLWVWAHEELSEPLKTRYFNIVANGVADLMEQPTYAQQYNGMKYRAEAAEAERDSLRAEVEAQKLDYQRLMDKHNALHINAVQARAEVERLRTESVPLGAIRGLAVEAIREITGCPDMTRGGKYLTDVMEGAAKRATYAALSAPPVAEGV